MKHLEEGGTLSDFHMDDLKVYLNDKRMQGRLDDLALYKHHFSDIDWEDVIKDIALLRALYDEGLVPPPQRAGDSASPPPVPAYLAQLPD